MPKSHSVVFIHLVWSTWDRMPLITSEIKSLVFSALRKEAERLGCIVVAANGIADHVHLLLQLPATLCVADAAKHIKGASAFVVNQSGAASAHFKWQGSYSAFSVSRWDVRKVADYIANQETHHSNNTAKPELENDTASR